MYFININRFIQNDECTIGRMDVYDEKNNKLFSLYTLEPEGPDCIIPEQNKRIPEGIYKCKFTSSSKSGNNIKGKLPLLYNNQVSQDRMIRIHIGNYRKDTEGCILVGTGYDEVKKNFISSSKVALTKLLDTIYDNEVQITISNKELK